MTSFLPLLTSLDLKDLIPLLTPAVAGGGVWIQGLLRKRDDRNRGKLARDEMVEMIDLLDKWMRTQEMACSPEEFQEVKKAAHQRLDDMYLTLNKLQESQTKHTTETPRPLVKPRPVVRRIFLLYLPGGFGGWMARVIFYVLILWAVFYTIGISSAPVPPVPLSTSIGVYVVIGLLVLPVHAWAVKADAKAVKQKQAGPLQEAS
jgi:hypothetical protein